MPDDNKIEIGQKVKLRLIMQGWTATNDKVMPGATERITTNDGQLLLNSDDQFSGYPEGVAETDAGIISLSAVITNTDKLYDYFLVEFRVWDKQKPGNEVTGSYKLYLK